MPCRLVVDASCFKDGFDQLSARGIKHKALCVIEVCLLSRDQNVVSAEAKYTSLRFHNGIEMKIGDGDGLRTRGALPKGTTRKSVHPLSSVAASSCAQA